MKGVMKRTWLPVLAKTMKHTRSWSAALLMALMGAATLFLASCDTGSPPVTPPEPPEEPFYIIPYTGMKPPFSGMNREEG
jgi:hypothetical protein